MAIKKIFKTLFGKKRNIKGSTSSTLHQINSIGENLNNKKNTSDDDSSDFRDGFNMLQDMQKNDKALFKKRTNIESGEGSDQETIKNPNSKDTQSEEIYSDYTNKSFKKNKSQLDLEGAEVIQDSNTVLTINTEVDGKITSNKIIKTNRKNSKGFSSRGS